MVTLLEAPTPGSTVLDLANDPIENDLTRRRFLGSGAAVGGALLLGGCADDDENSLSATPAPSETATAGPRTVSDVFGSITVPGNPQRIVALDDQVLGNMLVLGIEIERIAGWARGDFSIDNYPYLTRSGDLGAITNVGGTFDEPNLEGILGVRPDLMLMVAEAGVDFYTPIFDKLRTTGVPVFGAFNGYLRFDDYLRLLADVAIAVDRVDRAAELSGALRDRVTALRNQLSGTGGLPTAAFVRVPGDGTVQNTVQPLFDAIGLPGERPAPEEFSEVISPERLDVFDHDVLFVSDGNNEDETRRTLEDNPLWSRLPAVAAGRAFFVPEVLWGTGYSLPAVEAMLDDIEDLLLSTLTASPTATSEPEPA